MVGLERGTVERSERTPAWREAYEPEVDRLRPLVGDAVSGFDHVESTAVGELAATPVVDLLATAPASAASTTPS